MDKNIEGVNFERCGDYAICHVEFLSDDIQELIRRNLSTICYGSRISDYADKPLFSYKVTLKSFLERYKTKDNKTKIGMMGEFLSHILITELFDEFDVVSAFFNLEEKSIKKGFDLLLYSSSDKSVWITEVKSGNLHKGKTHDQTTKDLLITAKADLNARLNAQEIMYWQNAINSVLCSLNGKTDYKSALEEILINKGNAAAEGKATSKDHCVVLISSLFEPLGTKITIETAKDFFSAINKSKIFSKNVVFCIQKETYSRVIDFLQSEVDGYSA